MYLGAGALLLSFLGSSCAQSALASNPWWPTDTLRSRWKFQVHSPGKCPGSPKVVDNFRVFKDHLNPSPKLSLNSALKPCRFISQTFTKPYTLLLAQARCWGPKEKPQF